MSERLAALKRKLPDEVLARIMLYDSHPVADLMKALEFEPVLPSEITSAGLLLRLKEPAHFVPMICEFKRRVCHNRTRHLHGGVWLPLLGCYRCWRMIFDQWEYETVSELDYLPDWVKEEFLQTQLRTSAKPAPYICKASSVHLQSQLRASAKPGWRVQTLVARVKK